MKEIFIMKKSKVFVTLAAVVLIAAVGVGSTFAYLTRTSNTVKNTFSVGNIHFGDELDDGIRESEVARNTETGVYEDVDGEDEWTKTSQNYEDILPCENVYKDPTVIIAKNSVECYLFVKVEFNDEQVDEIDFTEDFEVIDENNHIYAYKGTIKKSEVPQYFTVFTSVTFADFSDAIAKEDNNFTLDDIEISACAIQAQGFDDVDAAFAGVPSDFITPLKVE